MEFRKEVKRLVERDKKESGRKKNADVYYV